MDKLEELLEELHRGLISTAVDRLAEGGLDELQIPRAELVPEEFVDGHQSIGDAELGVMVFDRLDGLGKEVVEPLDGDPRRLLLLRLLVYAPTADKSVGVPDLSAEIASLLDLGLIVKDIVAGRRAQEHAQTDCIGAVFLDKDERVGAVAEGLAHLAAELVAHDAREVDVAERNIVHELVARHDHPGYPEEDDVGTGHEVAGRIVVCEVGIGLALGVSGEFGIEHRNRPQPAAEPGIEDVFVLDEVCRSELRVDLLSGLESLFGSGFDHIGTVREIVCRYALTPPELAADAPVAGILHPVAVGVAVLVGDEFDQAVLHACKGPRGEFFHLEEPLCAEPGLDDGIGPLRIADRRGVVFHLLEVAGFFEHLRYLLAGDKPVFAHQDLCVFVETAVVVDDIEDGQIVPQTDFVVMDIVGRGHLEAARTEVHLDVVVFDDGDLLVDKGDEHLLAMHPLVALVIGVDANRGVGHDGLRTGCSHHYILVRGVAVTVGDEISHVVELARGILVDNLVVGDGCVAFRVPVDHAHTTVDPAFLVEIDEGVDDGFGKLRLHREAGAVPVAGRTELAELIEDDSAVLFLPLPGILKEFLTGEVFLADTHALELRHHLVLGGDTRVVGSGNPAGILAVHAGLADEHVVKGIVQHVAHVENTCHIGRRDDYSIGFAFVGFGVEALVP